MAAVDVAPSEIQSEQASNPSSKPRFKGRFRAHRLSLYILIPVLTVIGLATAWNLQGWPGRVNDDEGTYTSEAWAMLVPHHISHYTYWYDHPFLGWAQIAGYIWLTDGFHRYVSAVMAGREFMLVVTLISCSLLYLIARRLQFNRAFAVATVLLFGISPLAIYYHRMVFLDNIAVVWMLAALAFAASPRRSMASALGAGMSFAVATLSKETIVTLVPTVVWVLWQHTDRRTRKWNLTVFAASCIFILLGYPLFAALRSELFPGNGHVSLIWSLEWQFINRTSSGSVLDMHSGTYGLTLLWLGLDRWLLLAGVALIPFSLACRKLRPAALALGLQVAILVKGAYIPYMYVTAMLPFCALLIGGVANSMWNPLYSAKRARAQRGRRITSSILRHIGKVPVAAGAAVLVVLIAPAWWHALQRQSHARGDAAELAATAWIDRTLPKGTVVVVDDYMWPDVTMHGKALPVWLWKVDSDPWVSKHILPHGYKSIGYVVIYPQASVTLNTLPTLKAALDHSVVVKNFGGGLTARKISMG